MIFESRQLNPHAEPVIGENLQVGSVYYFLNYMDLEMLIPNLEPMIFIGRNLETADRDQVYFQDFESYQRGIRYEDASEGEAIFSVGSQHETSHVFAYERALEELMRCFLRRSELSKRRSSS